jgi:hypothetical protein
MAEGEHGSVSHQVVQNTSDACQTLAKALGATKPLERQ